MDEQQLELPLPEVPDNLVYFEDLTLTTDTMLAGSIGKYRAAFIIGIPDDGVPEYMGSHTDIMFWSVAIDRAKAFIMRYME